jgi:hypothetical protein
MAAAAPLAAAAIRLPCDEHRRSRQLIRNKMFRQRFMESSEVGFEGAAADTRANLRDSRLQMKVD